MSFSKRASIGGMLAGALSCLAVGYAIRAARADGAPPNNPLTYGGYLKDPTGAPLSGLQNIEIKLWATNPSSGQPLCDTPPAVGGTALGSDGYFEITLDPTCTAAVQTNATTYVEATVGGSSLGLTQLGAVPYALEASRASGASGALATTLAGLAPATSIPLVTAWQPYTATLASTGSNCASAFDGTNNFRYRRVGDSVEIEGNLQRNATGAFSAACTGFVVSFPPNLVAANGINSAGAAIISDQQAGGKLWAATVHVFTNTGATTSTIDFFPGGADGAAGPTAPVAFKALTIAFHFTAQIKGWTVTGP